ncbi:nuclear transport factor 2 family protein [Mycolicibacterium goodii]|uniref:nuclear transport factor 2 family protein n=1 Tax=Mycolicibacterium goodii TaxID=134601 RepID=UPI001BDD5F7F|nr:nuclear transport factor 2 family protein [Mycolicibacterium goodii]MBU8808198.1 nuclear transport factor 2 family protein [Mycolicibacterium goodii]
MRKVDEAQLRELVDRQEIRDALQRYSRGLDRGDRELALSAYHPDAIDDHGPVVLPAGEFVDWALAMHAEQHVFHTHQLTNTVFDIQGDVAHVETYYIAFCETRVKPNMVATGRYVDRFERRDGRWAIAARISITESILKADDFAFPPGFAESARSSGPAERSKQDVSYQRPLTVRRQTKGQDTPMS